MFNTTVRSMLACLLACAVPIVTAQSYQDAQRDFNERQLRAWQEKQLADNKNREDQLNGDVMVDSLRRHNESYQASSQGPGSSDNSSAAPILGVIMLVVAGYLVNEWSKRPERRHRVELYTEETKRQRQSFIYRQCKTARHLVQPTYEKPNSWAAIRIFQSNRAEEFQAAMARYQAAVAETEHTCKCVGSTSVSNGGFSEPEWKAIAERARSERPWMAVEESRVRATFDACATQSPSDRNLSWLYAGATR